MSTSEFLEDVDFTLENKSCTVPILVHEIKLLEVVTLFDSYGLACHCMNSITAEINDIACVHVAGEIICIKSHGRVVEPQQLGVRSHKGNWEKQFETICLTCIMHCIH